MELIEKLNECFKSYPIMDDDMVHKGITETLSQVDKNTHKNVYKQLIGFLDLTSLSATDTIEKIHQMVYKIILFQSKFPDYPNVAAFCVYPALVAPVREALQAQGVDIASVAGGFPASQTFIEVKVAETSLAVMDGADEVDIVLGVGDFLSGNYEKCFEDISELKAACGQAQLKVILETGALESADNIYKASILAMEAGADYIKTSTGKEISAATPEAAYIMCSAIKAFYEKSGRQVGFKPAGGIATTEEATKYYTIVKEVLGEAWLNSGKFRIGASRLANNLLNSLGHEAYF